MFEYQLPKYKISRDRKKALKLLKKEVGFIKARNRFRSPLGQCSVTLPELTKLYTSYPDPDVLYQYLNGLQKEKLRTVDIANSLSPSLNLGLVSGVSASLLIYFLEDWLQPSNPQAALAPLTIVILSLLLCAILFIFGMIALTFLKKFTTPNTCDLLIEHEIVFLTQYLNL